MPGIADIEVGSKGGMSDDAMVRMEAKVDRLERSLRDWYCSSE